jgi:PAS domain-containing protein
MDETEDTKILRKVFDAIPAIVFVVDHDVRIQEYNSAAADLLIAERRTIIKQRAGEVLHCLHSTEVQDGYGLCPECYKIEMDKQQT